MNETSTSHPSEATDTAPPEERAAGLPRRAGALPWRTVARCLLLAAVVGGAGYVSFRPGLLRLSILLSLVSPSRGESLAWKPEAEPPLRAAAAKFTPQPDEFRLAAEHTAGWFGDRAGLPADDWRGGELGAGAWRRESHNPWDWPDDARHDAPRAGAAEDAPGQKAESSFRARDAEDWVIASASSAAESAETETAGAPAPASAFAEATPERVPSLAPLTSIPPLTPPAPLSLPGPAAESAPLSLAPPALSLRPELPRPNEQPERAQPESIPLASILPPSPTPAPAAAPMPANWLDREITETIPGAYLTIYPKLKFIGLCTPDQGYIRKYNQIAVPVDTALPKETATDGRTPYGKYTVAAHLRDASGARLELSWPGGGVFLTGDRAVTDQTSGGFSLEAPHMEEIFTALADGAFVFIQE